MFDRGLPTTLLDVFDDIVDRYSEVLITGVRTDCFLDVDPECGAILKASEPTTHRLRATGVALMLLWDRSSPRPSPCQYASQ